MKVTIVHTNNKNQLLVSTKTMEKLIERFARDDSKLTITHFRESVPYLSNNYEGYKDLPKWMHIYPAAEFVKDENNNLKMKAFNGILLLKFGNITDVDGVEGIKRSVAILPSTLAAITGADGKTVIVLIKFQGENDSLPTSEADAEHLYRIAYQQIFPVYQAIVKAPLLISKQGYNKSTFCRRLLPPELQWGYSDNLVLSEKRQVYQAMAQFMVINLDEFNQISPQVQQGFLKNLIQLPTLKYKPPYGSHVMEFPRLASFIATSNMKDILTDPSGNRRFIGVELTGPIDVSVRPNYQQLFAQALTALRNGEKSYFDAEQVKLIMKNNYQFEVVEPIDQYFQLYFDLVEDEKEGEYLTAAEIFDYLKKQIGSSLKVNSLMGFGRKLANMNELKHKRFADGMKYLVKKK